MLRTSALNIISELNITGGCNVQYALHPESFEYCVIEVNPRVSRSSALASKATGYPIAKVAAKIALGYTLDEIKNAITGKTYASFEPMLDYCVVKIPRLPFDKFITAKRTLTTQMKATGEVMSICNNFEGALMKAIRSLEQHVDSLMSYDFTGLNDAELREQLNVVDDRRIWVIAEALRRHFSYDEIHAITKIDKWFIDKLSIIVEMEETLKTQPLTVELLKEAKRIEFPDNVIAKLTGKTEAEIHDMRYENGIVAVSAEAVNLTLDQIVSKGNGNSWETPVTQFSQPVKMKLKVADYDTAAGYEVVREHNGNLTKLTTSVSEDGTLTFETNQFSTYFIVKTAKKADNGNAKTENSSNTSSTTASSAAGSTDNAITAQSVSGEGVPAINIASAADQLLNLAKLSEDENKAVKAGNKTQFVLSASGMTPTKEEIALIQSVLGNNVIGQYLNLNLTFKISGREDRQITDLSAPMYIAITIPQNLVKHDSSIERTYRIVRIHGGVATLIDGTYDAATNQFTFATDGFSTYALVYEDVNTTLTGRSPKTGDSSMWMVWTLILCAGCGALFAAGKRYRKNR